MPRRAQASMMAGRASCLRTVAVFIDRSERSPSSVAHQAIPCTASTALMRAPREIGIAQQAGAVGEAEQLRKMRERAGALLAADHDEVVLQAVEIGHEHDAGLVEAGGRLEDVTREGHGRRQDVVEAAPVAGCERRERGRGGRRDGVEDAEQRIAVALLVAGDQLRVVEVVARIHAHALGELAAHDDLLVLVEQRDLDAVDLGGMRVDDRDGGLHRRHVVGAAPVAGERGIEHLAQPMDDHGLAGLAEHPVIDALVVGRRLGDAGQRPARHHDQAAAGLLDCRHLLLVGADHLVDGAHAGGVEMIGAAAREDEGGTAVPRLPGLAGLAGAGDQLERGRPVEAHAALGGVHGLRHAEAEVPEIVAVAQRRVPVDRAVEPGIVGGARIGHHVRRRERDAVEGAFGLVGIGAGLGQHEGLEPAGVGGQIDLEGGEDGCVHRPCPCPQCERSAACSTRFARAARVPGSVPAYS